MAIQNLGLGQIGAMTSLGEGTFTFPARAPTGEHFYFGIETLEAHDRDKWESYCIVTTLMAIGENGLCSIGSLPKIGSLIDDAQALHEFFAKKTIPDFWTKDPLKFEQLCTNLRNRKITINSPKAKELEEMQRALRGVNVRQQTHMVYASKLPIKGRIQFGSRKIRHFTDYEEKYGHMILTVGVKIQDIVEARGISKSLSPIVQGGYGGIAMMTHSCICMFVASDYADIQQYRVRPLKVMGELFFKAVPKEHMMINDEPAEEYKDGFEVECDVRVPVSVVASLHRAPLD